MQQVPQVPAPRSPRRALTLKIAIALSCVLSPMGAGLGLLIRRYCNTFRWASKTRWRGTQAFGIIGAILYGLLSWLSHILLILTLTVFSALIHIHLLIAAQWLLLLWAYNALLAPAFALLFQAIAPPIILQPSPPAPAATLCPAYPLLPASQPIEEIQGAGVLGYALEGDLSTQQYGNLFVYPLANLLENALILGMPGKGKSETMTRICYIARRYYGMKVVRFDGKGDWEDAAKFKLAMLAAGAKNVGVYPTDQHTIWYGSRQDVLNRLLASQTFEHSYYQGVCFNMLKMALFAPNLAPIDSLEELVRRLWPDRLKAIYRGYAEYNYVQKLSADAVWGPYGRFSALYSVVGDRLDGKKGFGDWDCSYYLLDQKRLQSQIAIFGKLLLDDFELFCSLRQQQKQQKPRILLCIDDYSAFSAAVQISDLFERLRSAGVATIAAAQGYQSLGMDRDSINRLLESGGSVLLHRCALPKPLLEVFATHEIPEVAFTYDQTEKDPYGFSEPGNTRVSMHMVEKPTIHANEVKRLPRGELFFHTGGHQQHVEVERLPLSPDDVQDQKYILMSIFEKAIAAWELGQSQGGVLPVPPPQPRRPRKPVAPVAPYVPPAPSVATQGPAVPPAPPQNPPATAAQAPSAAPQQVPKSPAPPNQAGGVSPQTATTKKNTAGGLSLSDLI